MSPIFVAIMVRCGSLACFSDARFRLNIGSDLPPTVAVSRLVCVFITKFVTVTLLLWRQKANPPLWLRVPANVAGTIWPPLIGNRSTFLVTDAGDTAATVMASFFKAAANDGKRTTVVLRPITVDPDFAVDVVPDFGVQLEDVLPDEVLPEEVLLLAVVLLLELPLHAAAKSATAAIAPSAVSRRKPKTAFLDVALVIKKCIPTPSWPATPDPIPSDGAKHLLSKRARGSHKHTPPSGDMADSPYSN